MKRTALALLALLVAASCGPRGAIVPPPVPVSGSACVAAEERLKVLGCAEYLELGDFSDGCEAAAADGRDWHAACISQAMSCKEVDSRYRGQGCD